MWLTRVALAGALILTASPLRAQDATPPPDIPTPAASVTPSLAPSASASIAGGFTATAHARGTLLVRGGAVPGSLSLAIAKRPNLTRIDILEFQTQFVRVRNGGVTVVIDQSANTVTAWSTRTQRYYVLRFPSAGAASRTPAPHVSPSPVIPERSPLSVLDVFSFSLQLTGHGMTDGIATSGLRIDLDAAPKGQTTPSHVSAVAQIVDASTFFPMTLDATAATPDQATYATLSYAVDDLTIAPPPLARFRIPAGYRLAPSIFEAVIAPRPSR